MHACRESAHCASLMIMLHQYCHRIAHVARHAPPCRKEMALSALKCQAIKHTRQVRTADPASAGGSRAAADRACGAVATIGDGVY